MNSNTINDNLTMTGESGKALLANRYRIVRQLGQGGMGSVWLAEDMQLDGKLFAIKMLPSILVSNKRAYQQLKSEALVAMKLVHPNIVQIRAFEENNGNPFLVMDYIDGETLDDWLGDRGQESGGRSQVSEEEVVRLLKPIAEALDYAHGEGVIHRDIKPANVMIRKDGRPFIMDFGIAREIQETMTRVTGKMSSGTLMYMSPEQLNGDMPKKEQDIYSFAAMVYECLKGEPPFVRGNIEYQIMNKDPEPLIYVSSQGSGVSSQDSVPTIADAVMRGLAKNPEDRPKSCVEVLETKFNRVERVELGNEIPLEAFPYLPSDMRMRKGITATQSQSDENAELSKSHVEDHAQASGIIEKQVTSTEEKKTTLFFWGFVVVVLMIVSLSKFYDIRQARIQQEEQQKIVAEQKRLAMEARLGASMAQKEAEKNDAKKLAVEEYDAAIMMKGLADNA
ncbi:MAG: protein kinase, partial [Kiritimatiellae bacterium]|nr:protein kinase [Kiritimatiellia bacterium]